MPTKTKDPQSLLPAKPPRRARKTVKNSHTSPAQVQKRKRMAEALEYRLIGHTYAKIGEAMGIDPSEACRYVQWAMAEITREPAEQVILQELERLDLMLASIMSNASEADYNAQNNVFKIMERRAKLLGLDKPQGVTLSGPGGGPVITKLEVEFITPKGHVVPKPGDKA